MSTPQATIHVCAGVRLSNDYKHTIYFDNLSNQQTYFAGKVKRTFSAYTYLRKNWSLDVAVSYETAEAWNYLYFKNFSNGKIYYYFITKINYISDSMVRLDIELDVMQTYLFDYSLSQCFIDREHSATDDIGDNLVDEGLETGEYINARSTDVNIEDLCVLVMTTYHPAKQQTVLASNFDGIFGAVSVLAVDMNNVSALGAVLQQLDSEGKSDCILSMWMYPKSLVKLVDGETWGATVFNNVQSADEIDVYFSENKNIDNHTVRNNKLYTYPYNFIYASNNSGGGAVYRYEYFTDKSNRIFRVVGTLGAEASTKLVPCNYKGTATPYDEGLIGGNYPTCAWNQDVYKLWLAQNQNQQNLSFAMDGLKIAGGVAGVVGGIVTGNPLAIAGGVGGITSGSSSIANTLAQRKDKAIQPPQAKGVYSSSINIKTGKQTFTLYARTITNEHAKIIDNYFDMYGYKTNRVKIPNRNVRENWTYVKTIDCHAIGNICTEDLRKIQSIYDNGVTFWLNGDNIGNYSLTNKCK